MFRVTPQRFTLTVLDLIAIWSALMHAAIISFCVLQERYPPLITFVAEEGSSMLLAGGAAMVLGMQMSVLVGLAMIGFRHTIKPQTPVANLCYGVLCFAPTGIFWLHFVLGVRKDLRVNLFSRVSG